MNRRHQNWRRIGVVDTPEVNKRAARLIELVNVPAAARSADDGDVQEDAYVRHDENEEGQQWQRELVAANSSRSLGTSDGPDNVPEDV